MARAVGTQGKSDIRGAMKTLVSHVGVSTDSTAWADDQTAIDPTGTATNLIKPATKVDVDEDENQLPIVAFDSSITIDGDSEFTDQTIMTISLMKGPARTDMISRSVRTQGIGVQAGDLFTIGPRTRIDDNS